MADKKPKNTFERVIELATLDGYEFHKYHRGYRIVRLLCEIVDSQNERLNALEKWVESKRECGL